MNKERIKKAYTSRDGLGLFDLIPGLRDLPYRAKFLLMVVTVVIVVSTLFFLLVV